MRPGPFIAAFLIVGAGALGWWWVATPVSAPWIQLGAQRNAEGRRSGPPRVETVPVTVAIVAQEAVPVYREGIGTVQALSTVMVRTQVDGRLLSVEFTEGQMVKKGDVLARIDPTTYRAQYDQAVAKKAQDEAALANARIDLARYQRLAQSNAGPKQQADQQVALVAQLEAQIQSDDAAIANARAVLAYTTVLSPIDGRTGLRLVDAGNIVKAGDASGIVSLTQIMPVAVVFTLPQRDLEAVNAALARGIVPVEVMAADGRRVLANGRLQTIDNQIDVSTGTIKLKAIIPNNDLKLWPGQFVSSRVVVETLIDAKVVPNAAVRRGPAGTFAYVVDPDMKAMVRPVIVALQDSARAVIAEGLAPGERVVTIGFNQLADGKLVNIDEGVTPAAGEPAARAAPAGNDGKPDGGGGERGRATTSGDKSGNSVPAAAASEGRRRPISAGAGKPG